MKKAKQKVCLTIAGLDPSGGAGTIADVRTFTAFGCAAAAAITSLTFQNTRGVFGAAHQTAAVARGQILPVVEEFTVAATKTGMLPTAEIIGEIAGIIAENELKNIVVDPVIRSTSGFDLIDDAALRELTEKLFPLADLITPNLPEAGRVTRMKIETETDIAEAARLMREMGAANVLIKGGHFYEGERRKTKSGKKTARDFLFVGGELTIFETEFVETTATRGTGCVLSSAIAANLALGKSLPAAVEISKRFVHRLISEQSEVEN